MRKTKYAEASKNQMSFLTEDIVPEKKKIEQQTVSLIPKRLKKAEVDALDTFYPFLYPDEYNETICKSFKGQTDANCRSFVTWDHCNDIKVIQQNLFISAISDIRALEYTPESMLVELLEWIIDDPVDDFSFLSCMSAMADPGDYSKIEILELSRKNGVSEQEAQQFLAEQAENAISKASAYDYAEDFLREQRGLLAYRIAKKKKQLQLVGLKNKELQKLFNKHISQGEINLAILDVCLEIYF